MRFSAMRQSLLFISIISLFWFCEPRTEIVTTDSGAQLEFSEDSVLFDTVFTEIRNITKRVRVYNRNNNAINVSEIKIAGGESSPYQLIINGEEGKAFKDVLIRGKDSIYVLVNIDLPTPQPVNNPFIINDEIQFFSNGNIQAITLQSWGQDAIFYTDSLLECNLFWSNEKPIVIVRSVGVPENCKLTIEAGTKIYLDNASSILVFGTLEANGTFENPITFCGIRLEEDFDNIPGQWGNNFGNGIWFFDGSKDNIIRWAEIKNSTTGIRLGSVYDEERPDLILENTIVKNMAGDGLISFGGDLNANNNLFTNCGGTAVSLLLGGTHNLYHNTIANYSFAFNREDAAIFLTDFFPDSLNIGIEINPIQADIQNNIIWGDLDDEFGFNFQGAGNGLNLDYNFIKLNDTELINTFGDGNNIIQGNTDDLLFKDFREYDFNLDTLSPAKDQGNVQISNLIGPDLNNNSRNDGMPDMGAFERED